MLYIENNSTDPYYNLALEEHLLNCGGDEDILLLWQNENTVVVGRYQNTAQEINELFCRMNNIRISRRNTGGGAVYHDLGNLNFSIITDYKQGDDISFGRFLNQVREALHKLGIDAQLQGRNDLVVDGRKISGSAQTIQKGRILHHGTLLCCTNLDMLSGALQNDPEKFESKATTSVRSRVANIQDFNKTVTVSLLKSSLVSEFGRSMPLKQRELNAADITGTKRLQKNKYETWQWNYGESPAFNFSKKTRFPQGTVAVSLVVEEGIIRQCAINGDFLGCLDISDVEKALVGVKRQFTDVATRILNFDAGLYFGGVSAENIAECFF